MRDIEDYEKKYAEEPGEKVQVKYRKRMIKSKLCEYKHDYILEIGCGLDPMFMHLNDYKHMTVVEPSEFFYSNAVKMLKDRSNVTLINSYFEDFADSASPNEDYDFIILSSLLHELENPEIFLQGLRHVCSDTTVVHINVPNALSLHRILAKEMGLIKDEYQLSEQQIEMQRHHVFNKQTLRDLLESNGFEILEMETYFPKFLTGAQMDKIIKEGIISENIYEGLYKLINYIPEYGSEISVQVRRIS